MIVVELASGAVVELASNVDDWVGRQGPIIYDHTYHGEVYDSRQALADWASLPVAAFPAGTWSDLEEMNPRDVHVLTPQTIPPVRVVENYTAISTWTVSSRATCDPPALGGAVPEGQYYPSVLTLACVPGTGTIKSISFASYGTPTGDTCATYARSASCDAPTSLATVQRLCLGKTRCDIYANTTTFGGTDPCPNVLKRLAVVASGCSPVPVPPGNETLMFDFGQNMAGFATLTVPAGVAAGTAVVMRFGEIVTRSNTLYNSYCSNDVRPTRCACMMNRSRVVGQSGRKVH